jgi:signal transduction histidine kinase
VIACNNDGVWNEAGTFLDFSIAPAYYQTKWFLGLCAAAVLVLLWALYQLRLHQLQRRYDRGLEERLRERTRIARDLHDTLLQRFHGLLLRFQTAYELLPSRPAEAKESLGSAIDGAAEALTEGRDAVQGLRAFAVEDQDLAHAIKALGEELEGSGNERILLRADVQGSPRPLRPFARDEIYRIAAEALRNAFRHAEAKQIEVELWYEERLLRLRVRDDGKGIDPEILGKDAHAGHYGLHGMRERATLISAKLAVWSAPDSGTEIELSVPASGAYATPTSAGRSWLPKRLFGQETRLKS